MVLLAVMPGAVSDGLPTSRLAVPPLPPSPWQSAQPFSANSFSPCAAVPLPGGSPVPSGRMKMSHALRSDGAIGLPRPGVLAAWAAAGAKVSAAKRPRTIRRERLNIDMLDLPVGFDAP